MVETQKKLKGTNKIRQYIKYTVGTKVNITASYWRQK